MGAQLTHYGHKRRSEHRTGDLQLQDGVHVHPERLQDLVGVLAVLGRPHQLGGLLVELQG